MRDHLVPSGAIYGHLELFSAVGPSETIWRHPVRAVGASGVIQGHLELFGAVGPSGAIWCHLVWVVGTSGATRSHLEICGPASEAIQAMEKPW